MTDLSEFQRVLEALQYAQAMGALAIKEDSTTFQADDQDSYPRGLVLTLERKDPKWASLRFLSKHLDWVSLTGKQLHIKPPHPMKFRLTEVAYLRAVADALEERGIACFPDVYYR